MTLIVAITATFESLWLISVWGFDNHMLIINSMCTRNFDYILIETKAILCMSSLIFVIQAVLMSLE